MSTSIQYMFGHIRLVHQDDRNVFINISANIQVINTDKLPMVNIVHIGFIFDYISSFRTMMCSRIAGIRNMIIIMTRVWYIFECWLVNSTDYHHNTRLALLIWIALTCLILTMLDSFYFTLDIMKVLTILCNLKSLPLASWRHQYSHNNFCQGMYILWCYAKVCEP